MISNFLKVSLNTQKIDTQKKENCKKLTDDERDLLLELNEILSEITYRALDKYWINHVLYNRGSHSTPKIDHFKDLPEWKQLQQIEGILAKEYRNLKHHKEFIGHQCAGCEHVVVKFDGFKNRWHVNSEGCVLALNSGKCFNIKKMKKEL